MTLSKIVTLALLLSTALLTGTAAADPAETAKAAGEDAKWLFIQTAPELQFDGTTLTLKNINPSMVMFTDRPARMAEALPTATFLAGWDKGGAKSFKADPPNAALTSLVDGKLQTATVELSQPRLEGTTLTFKARVIEGIIPVAGKTTSLFIDEFCIGCIG